jgi:hypothetical protein
MIIGIALSVSYPGTGGPHFAAPSAPDITLTPGDNPGEVSIQHSIVGMTWGDGATPGDGLGAPDFLEWWSPTLGWQVLADPASTSTTLVVLDPADWDGNGPVWVRGVSTLGRRGRRDGGQVAIPGGAQVLTALTFGGLALIDPVTGRALTYWKDAA